jgi:cytochrome c-type biogenesis protein CcmE
MTRKQRRFALIGTGLAVLALSAALVLSALKESIIFFNSPTDLVEKHIAPGTRIRLGGLVKAGSLVRGDNLLIRFEVTDGNREVPVVYKELCGSFSRAGVIAEVRWIAGHVQGRHHPRQA